MILSPSQPTSISVLDLRHGRAHDRGQVPELDARFDRPGGERVQS